MGSNKISETLNLIANRDDIPQEVRDAISNAASNIRPPIEYDLWIYRFVVIILGLIALLTVMGGIYITLVLRDAGTTLPDAIIALGSAAVGALAGLVTPSRTK